MFDKLYRCYSVSQTGQHDHLENGDKILMPTSALVELSSMKVDYPLLFKLTNTASDKTSHCGVMEFSSDEGTVLLPTWVMRNLNLLEGDIVQVSNASLEKATFVRLQPHETAFVETSDPKAVLETCLRKFSCLTIGDTIPIDYLGRKFSVDVLETKPGEAAVSVIETDCEVDFATPLDHKEPEKRVPVRVKEEDKKPAKEAAQVKFRAFMGVGRRLDGGVVQPSTDVVQNDDASMCCENSNKRRKVEKAQSFKPFTGKSYRLM